MQAPAEDFQQRLLAFENALICLWYREPAAAVDFGYLNQTLRPRRPFDLAQIAFQVLGVTVSLKRPCRNGLSTRLFNYAQPKKYSLGCESCLFMEFTPGSAQSVFTFLILALWDGPGTVVLLRPERTARVN
jgi:hypothetical protein